MENLYKRVGSCGPFQVCHCSLAQFTRFASAWAFNILMFGIYDPGWICSGQRPPSNSSVTTKEGHGTKHRSHSGLNLSNELSKYERLPLSVIWNNETKYQNSSSCKMISSCDVEFDPSSRTIVSEFELICDKSFVPSIILCILMVGMLFGVYVCGQVGEWYGRKVSLYGSTALCSAACLLAIFSPTWQIYSVFQFFNGAGVGGIMVTCNLFSMEFLDPTWRGRLVGIPTYNVSFVLFAVSILVLRDWVSIHIAASVLCALACAGVLWSPESLRWLLVHNKEEQAKRVVEKMLKCNRTPIEIKDAMEILTVSRPYEDGQEERKYSYLDLFRQSQIRLITIKTSVIWFSSLMTYFALTFGVRSLTGDFYVNALISSGSEIPALLAVAPSTNMLGRRMAIALFMLLGTIGCFTAVITYYVANHDIGGIIMNCSAFFAKAAAVACVNALNVLTAELYPTAVRNVGVAFVNTVGRIGAIISSFLVPRDQTSLVICYIVLGVASFVNVAVVTSLPETKDKPLKDRLEIEEEVTVEVKTFQD